MLVAGSLALSCASAPPSGLAAYQRGVELERQAEEDERRTREKIYDRAREQYRIACDAGHRTSCDEYRRLDEMLSDLRGECTTADQCAAQGASWLPDWRGESRLQRLCAGRRVHVWFSVRPPAWPPHGASCVLLGDFYRDRGRGHDAARMYASGCEGAAYAIACRREAERITAARESAAVAARYLDHGCDLDDGEACARHAALLLARHRAARADELSFRDAVASGSAASRLERARRTAARACELGVDQGCRSASEIEGEARALEALAASGCVFFASCAVGEVCNVQTGSCEGPKSKGPFYEAYDLGLRAHERRRFADARAAFQKASEMVPTAAGPWRWLGLIANEEGRWSDCVEALSQALRRNPGSRHRRAMQALRAECESRAAKKE